MDATEDLPDLPDVELCHLPGSERPPAAGFLPAAARPVPPESTIEATLVLRRQASPGAEVFDGVLTPAELAARYGAAPADVALVQSTLAGLGAAVVSVDAASRRVKVAGSAALLGRIFGTDLQEIPATPPQEPGPNYAQRHRSGGLSIPVALDGVVTAVLGLDDRPQSRPLFRMAPAAQRRISYTPLELGRIYNFPPDLDGSGTTIALIELGGGFAQAELDTYFSSLGIKRAPVEAVGIDGAANLPEGNPNGADGEVLLDIEVAGALAPGARIVVYFAPNTDAGFLNAIATAAHATPTPAAISISWGLHEDGWTAQARTAMDEALADAALLGVSTSAAAGDDGSADQATDGGVHVDFPASSPHALACGGTRLLASAGKVEAETVWNNGVGAGATGGGVSGAFPLPTWQRRAGVPLLRGRPGRGVPDVAAVADPQTGYRVLVDGVESVMGGTSAVSPLWSALLACLAQGAGRPFGLVQPKLYPAGGHPAVQRGFRDVLAGSNGAYQAGPGWDPCTGLGVPDGAALRELLVGRKP
ncbi:S53 family peptidase [Arthrobacter sp. 35W]|uniref:S53 family peptidase n=1 Tax=Arthrobacter sp. 35W TaxID=1132441 RepID=UPI00040D0341|nr:S53 family peptidase [Arthrobacter sp. 35W]